MPPKRARISSEPLTTGNVGWVVFRNLTILSRSLSSHCSWTLIANICNGLSAYFTCSLFRCLNSSRQGGHQLAKKVTSTGRSISASAVRPSATSTGLSVETFRLDVTSKLIVLVRPNAGVASRPSVVIISFRRFWSMSAGL